MTVDLSLLLVVAVLFGTGVYLLLARSVVRALIGFLLMSNAVNVMFLIAGGRPGAAPIVQEGTAFEDISDPLPQAMVLTAIVIGLCMTAFLLALAHRGFQLSRTDVLTDDPEDARIHRLAQENDLSASEFDRRDGDDEQDDDGGPEPGGDDGGGQEPR